VLGLLNRLEEERRERGEIPLGSDLAEDAGEGDDLSDDDFSDDDLDGDAEDDDAPADDKA
jgi:hypothetical protein